MTSIAVSAVALVLGIVVFMALCMKGTGTVIAGVIATIIVGVTTKAGLVTSLFTTFLSGAAGFLQTMMLIFAAGAVFGGLLNATGCSDRIGVTFANLMGEKNIFILIYVLVIILQMAGVQPALVISFISFGMMRKLNLPRYIAMVACMGSSFVVLFGAASTNMICSAALGTTIYTQPVFTVIMAVIHLVLIHLYVLYLIKDARKKGIGYDPLENEAVLESRKDDTKLPPFPLAIAPVIFVIAWCLVTINCFSFTSGQAAVSGMIIASLFLLIALGKNIKGNKFAVLEGSVKPILYALLCSCAAVGFATVVKETAAFEAIIQGASNWGMSGYVLAVIGTAVFSAVCADGNAGSASFLAIMGARLMESGLNIGIIHRLIQWSSATFDSLPHNGAIVMFLTLFGYDHKKAYKYLVVSNIVITTITTVIGLIIASIFF